MVTDPKLRGTLDMIRINRHLRAAAVVALALAVGACGDDATGPDALDDAVVLDMAVLAADATLEDVAMWVQPLGFGALPAAPSKTTPGQPGGHGTFSGEFSGTRAVTFFDAAGVEQDGFDRLLTASIHLIREIAGQITRDNFSASIERARDMTVSGLAGEETHRTWNGSGTENVTRSGVMQDGTERSHSMSGTFTYNNVVVPIPGSDPRFPVSGTITRSMTATRTGPDGTVTRSVEIVITFDGTAIAQAVVNGEPMEIDLAAREGRNPLRRMRR
jgi:hypothetical protein